MLRPATFFCLLFLVVLAHSSAAAGFVVARQSRGTATISKAPGPDGPESGFCINGVFPNTTWPPEVVSRPNTWGSYCKDGDAGTGWKSSNTIQAGKFLSIYAAGYPGTLDVRLAVLNVQTGQQLLLRFPVAPREKWVLETFLLPSGWRHQPIRVIASDQSTKVAGWLGFSEPTSSDAEPATGISAFRIIRLTVLILIISLLPSAAVCILAAVRGIADALDLVAFALATVGLVGYASFWLYFANRTAGLIFSYATLTASCCVLVAVISVKQSRHKLTPLKKLVPPGALLVFGSMLIMSLGLLFGSHGSLLSTPANRYAPPDLAGDNYLPKILADAVFAGHIPKPMHADWLSSDRPPLQAGNSLWIYAWITEENRDLAYLVCSVILQCLFLVGLSSCLAAFEVNPKALAIVMAVSFFCGFIYLNAFYTWPKLYPTALLLIIAGYLLPGPVPKTGKPIATGAVVGVLAALSMLAHGGSVFALLGIVVTLLLLRRHYMHSFWITAAIVAFGLYFPWTLYQKLFDPPGDRLIKWHIAGLESPHPHESVTALLISNYRRLTIKEILWLKFGNLKTILGNLPSDVKDLTVIVSPAGDANRIIRDAGAASLRKSMFYHWTSCVGLALFGPLALLLGKLRARHEQPEFIAGIRMWLCTGLIIALWCILMYGPDYTVVHQGTYLTVIFALAGSWLAFWTINARMAVGLAAAQIGYNAVVYIWLTPSHLQVGHIPAINPYFPGFWGMVITCVISAAAFVTILLLASKQKLAASRSTADFRSDERVYNSV